MSNTPHTACAVFTFKDQESKQKFIDFCNGPKGLDITRNYKGCQSIECYKKHDNELFIVICKNGIVNKIVNKITKPMLNFVMETDHLIF